MGGEKLVGPMVPVKEEKQTVNRRQQLEVRKVTGRSASMWAIKNRVLGSSQRG